MTYVELADYLFSIYLGIPEPYEIDGEVLSDEREYLYEVFTSDEHTKEIQRIVELDRDCMKLTYMTIPNRLFPICTVNRRMHTSGTAGTLADIVN